MSRSSSAPFSRATPQAIWRCLAPVLLLFFVTAGAQPLGAAELPTQHVLFSPYWYVDSNTEALLEIANHNLTEFTASPTLLLRGEEALPLEPVTVPPRGTIQIPLRELVEGFFGDADAADIGRSPRWGDGSRAGSVWGSALIETAPYFGGVSGWIVSENLSESLSVNSLFRHDGWGAGALESMWWKPTADSHVIFGLQNLLPDEVMVRPTLFLHGETFTGAPIPLSGHGATTMRLQQIFPTLPEDGASHPAGAVRFEAAGSSLLGRVIIADEAVGYSAALIMRNPERSGSRALEIPSAMIGEQDRSMGFPNSTYFESKVYLANTSSDTMSVQLSLFGKDESGDPLRWDGPTYGVEPAGARVIDLEGSGLFARSGFERGLVAVRLEHTGEPGTLLAEAVSHDRSTLSHVFPCPFVDVTNAAVQKIAISFDLSQQRNTVLIAKSTHPEAVDYTFVVNYEVDGSFESYAAPVRRIRPDEIITVDLKRVRDSQLPGQDGKALPRDLVYGNAHLLSDVPALIAVDPTFDPVSGISRLCQEECGPEYIPLAPIGGPEQAGSQDPEMMAWWCGFLIPPPPSIWFVQYGRIWKSEFAGTLGCEPLVDELYCEFRRCPGWPQKCTPVVDDRYGIGVYPDGGKLYTWGVWSVFGIGFCYPVGPVEDILINPCPSIE